MNVRQRIFSRVLWGALVLWSLAVYPQSEFPMSVLPDSASREQASLAPILQAPILQEPILQESAPQEQERVTGSDVQFFTDLLGVAPAQPEFVDPEVAFQADLQAKGPDTLVARFSIEGGYYLYQDKIGFSSQTDGVSIGNVSLPPGRKKTDSFFGDQIVYYNGLEVELPLIRTRQVDQVMIKVDYQGCADQGICYSPVSEVFAVSLPGIGAVQASQTTDPVKAITSTSTQVEAGGVATDSRFWWAVLFAFAAGIALTFTPCVLPMIPILASIVVGQGDSKTRLQSGLLSIVFVLGTAVTYTAVGVVAGATGNQLQAYFQNPWGIGIVVVILVGLSLSMFGLYNLQLPVSVQSKIQARAGRLKGGALGGVFVMGLISALIVGACVSPVLIAVLGLAIERADPVLGGAIMFSMALGSGVILVGLGFGAAFLLPKAGRWMENIKYVFGAMLLGVAVYILGALPQVPVLYLWGILLILGSVYLGALQSLPVDTSGWRYLQKGIGVFALVWGILALLGGMADNRDITRPIDWSRSPFFASSAPESGLPNENTGSLFTRVSDVGILQTRLTQAKIAGKPVMLDYYADWCIDCIRMERQTFADSAVRQALGNFVMLQVDVTDPRDPSTNALKKRYGVYGPPAMLFFDSTGEERKELRRYGFMGADEFITHINQI